MRTVQPDLRDLDDAQKAIAREHWQTWLKLRMLESQMTAKTLHRLALARGRYWKKAVSRG